VQNSNAIQAPLPKQHFCGTDSGVELILEWLSKESKSSSEHNSRIAKQFLGDFVRKKTKWRCMWCISTTKLSAPDSQSHFRSLKDDNYNLPAGSQNHMAITDKMEDSCQAKTLIRQAFFPCFTSGKLFAGEWCC